MNEQAVVFPVTQTTLNLPGLIQACREMEQPNPTNKPDSQGLTGPKHTIAVLDEIQDKPYLTGNVLHLGYMVMAHPDDMQRVLVHTPLMTHLYHKVREASCVIITGTVNQWIDTCRRACCLESDQVVRFVFNRVYRHLEQTLPREMLSGHRTDNQDGTFLLEHK